MSSGQPESVIHGMGVSTVLLEKELEHINERNIDSFV